MKDLNEIILADYLDNIIGVVNRECLDLQPLINEIQNEDDLIYKFDSENVNDLVEQYGTEHWLIGHLCDLLSQVPNLNIDEHGDGDEEDETVTILVYTVLLRSYLADIKIRIINGEFEIEFFNRYTNNVQKFNFEELIGNGFFKSSHTAKKAIQGLVKNKFYKLCSKCNFMRGLVYCEPSSYKSLNDNIKIEFDTVLKADDISNFEFKRLVLDYTKFINTMKEY